MNQRRPVFIHEPPPVRGSDHPSVNYADLFETPLGQLVFADMARIADFPSIDTNAIDTNQAIWILARQALIKQIRGLVERGRK